MKCNRCGNNNPDPRHSTCPECRESSREKSRLRKAYICIKCGGESDDKHYLCDACRQSKFPERKTRQVSTYAGIPARYVEQTLLGGFHVKEGHAPGWWEII